MELLSLFFRYDICYCNLYSYSNMISVLKSIPFETLRFSFIIGIFKSFVKAPRLFYALSQLFFVSPSVWYKVYLLRHSFNTWGGN